jgi:hypothetical protein
MKRKFKFLVAGVLGAMALHPASLFACAACYGASDSPMAQGMNWGILSLLGVVVMVLGSVASFFVFIGRKAAASAEEWPGAAAAAMTDSNTKTEPPQKS